METLENLPLHEWLIVLLIIAIMCSLTIITTVREDSVSKVEGKHSLISNEISVSIHGSVAKPGTYILKKGDTVKDLLLLVEPLNDANLSKLKSSSLLRNNQQIFVPSSIYITIYIEGAVVKPGPLQIPKGTRLVDLIEYVEFLDVADKVPLRKKRFLKEDEIIFIPSLKSGKT